MISVLVVCSSCILSGCGTFDAITPTRMAWPLPDKPETKHVVFVKTDTGYSLTPEEAKKLADNIDEMKAYIQKLETLVDGMKRYYDAR